MDYQKFLSRSSKLRKSSIIRELNKQINFYGEKAIPLSGGIPIADVFPFAKATFTTKDGIELTLEGKFMEDAQQYGVTEGYPPLLEIIRGYQTRLHNPPYADWAVIMTSGAQEGISHVFDMLIDEGDYVIGGEHCFSGTIDIFRPLGAKYLPVEQDKDGMIPDSLRQKLSTFDSTLRNRLKVIYSVPNGGNPEAYTVSAERRKEIYKIAQEYDLLILEDDPYQFIVFDLIELPCSFLSLDVDGRVIRCDSYSKTISPGFRLGCVTAPRPLSEKLVFKIQVTSQQCNCLSQVVLYQLLQVWGFEGYIRQTKKARDEYVKQKDLACEYANKWLKNLAEWSSPSGGMFMWIKVMNIEDSKCIVESARKRHAFFAPGLEFRFDRSASPCIRVSFSNATIRQFDEGFKILSECIRDFLSESNSSTRVNGDAGNLEKYR
ncbi:hypothetical protein CHUAL_000272 [Chamberlinius hualienensis]